MEVLSGAEPTLYTTRFALMGGNALVQFVDDRGRDHATRIARAVEDEARRIEFKYSRFRESSLVAELARNAGRCPVAVDGETAYLVNQALDLARLTGGRFDPTLGPLARAWDWKSGRVPSQQELDALLPLVGFHDVVVRDGTVFLAREGMSLDLGGIGKEYAVDRVAELLVGACIRSAIVNFAGDVRTVGGRGDGRPWSIGVLDPRDRTRARFAVRTLGSAGVATSGDYERCFVDAAGTRYHHILDARTGWPARGLASVTVVAATAFDAGRHSTAAFLLGPADGFALLRDAPGIEGVLITDEGELLATAGMERLSDLPGSLYAGYPDM